MTSETRIDEAERLRVLHGYEIVDTPSEESFDRITRLAQKLFGAPISLVTFIDDRHAWFKSHQGLKADGAPRALSFCAHVVNADRPVIVTDAAADPRFARNPLVAGEPKIRFYAGAPLRTPSGVVIGAVSVIDRRPRAFDGAQAATLADLAAMVMNELELRRLLSRDPLTGLNNRAMFAQLAEREVRRARRHDNPMSALIVDLDRDIAAGDATIASVARLCKSMLRENDVLGRWAGAEFVIAAPNTDLSQAHLLGERIRALVASTATGVTVSIGVTECGPDAASFTQPLARADVALHAAKSCGGNRVEKATVEKGRLAA